MTCKQFWKKYEESGMTPELEAHLRDCQHCPQEMETEKTLLAIAQSLPEHEAPDYLWERISRALPYEQPETNRLSEFGQRVADGIRSLFLPGRVYRFKPVLVGLTIIITSVLATHYYRTKPFSSGDRGRLVKDAADNLEEIEQEYLAAIDRLTEQVELNKESIDPDLYDLYSEKLAVLDEYILQCKEALEENEFNPNARKYLALAYIEKMDTLQKMSEQVL